MWAEEDIVHPAIGESASGPGRWGSENRPGHGLAGPDYSYHRDHGDRRVLNTRLACEEEEKGDASSLLISAWCLGFKGCPKTSVAPVSTRWKHGSQTCATVLG